MKEGKRVKVPLAKCEPSREMTRETYLWYQKKRKMVVAQPFNHTTVSNIFVVEWVL